jgi:hypothetical protein
MKFLSWLFSWFGGPSAPAPSFVTKVQAETVKYCGFLPQASSVAGIIGAMTGQAAAVATAVGVASTICKAVSSKKLMAVGNVGGPVTYYADVDGALVPIEGEFVKSK